MGVEVFAVVDVTFDGDSCAGDVCSFAGSFGR